MKNPEFRNKLKKALKGNEDKIKYPDGYKKWKQKFNYFYKETKGDLHQTLDIIYGPGGGVDNYKGSLYRNTDFKVPKKVVRKKKNKKKKSHKSNIFKGLQKPQKQY